MIIDHHLQSFDSDSTCLDGLLDRNLTGLPLICLYDKILSVIILIHMHIPVDE